MEQTIAAPAIQTAPSADEAFGALYRDSREDLFAYVAGMLRDRSLAEDVTALAFERAWRKRASFSPERGSHRAWLFGIARNAALDELRKAGRETSFDERGEEPDQTTPAPDERAELALKRDRVRAAMQGLSTRERELVALKFFGGLSNGEIAEVIGVSPTNAGTQLHRTIQKLRRACNEA